MVKYSNERTTPSVASSNFIPPQRDADLLITSELLYQLSYIGIKRARVKPKLSFAGKVIAWRHHIFPSIGKFQAERSNLWKK